MRRLQKIQIRLSWRSLWRWCLRIVFFALFTSSALADSNFFAPKVVGTWFTKSQSQVTIEPCEQGYCGVLTDVVIPQFLVDKYGDNVAAMQGNYIDALNKDPALRGRPVLGLQILVLNSDTEQNRLEGTIYNPEDGETYNGFMELIDDNNIRLSGCILFNLICLGEDWVRVTPSTASR